MHHRNLTISFLTITLLVGCAKDLIIDYGKNDSGKRDSIRLVGAANSFYCDDPAYAKQEKVVIYTLMFSDGVKELCELKSSVDSKKQTPNPIPVIQKITLSRQADPSTEVTIDERPVPLVNVYEGNEALCSSVMHVDLHSSGNHKIRPKPSVQDIAKGVRVEATLPVNSKAGMSSSGYSIYSPGKVGAPIAAGQVFAPEQRTPVLFNIGFHFSQYNAEQAPLKPDFKLQVRLSEWDKDRPAPKVLWVSEPRTIRDFRYEWLYFDIPHLRLNPAKQYVAWITLSDLNNPSDSKISVPSMGPTSTYPTPDAKGPAGAWTASCGTEYPKGKAVFFVNSSPDDSVAHMTKSAWRSNPSGHNLHFKMTFENRAALNPVRK
ncbi:hypothetical protein [Polaromonas sp. A23]|uniref:hypothetical protein n=1 Tax=Polaromonas sp. A23 TaxID=1944133 RepID=UPI00111565B6|nr:hypothetical protein [Polaromonas sp. A23]